jgi:hypothetical protein
MEKEKQQISSLYSFGQIARVETVTGSGMNIPATQVPAEAYKNPKAFDLEATWKNAQRIGYPELKVVPR